MSAVSNLTYVWVQDASASAPDKDGTPVVFSNYNEAMSFAKWAVKTSLVANVYVSVWNYNGGSGYWSGTGGSANFNPVSNYNWP